MTDGFGGRLLDRARHIARRAADGMADALVAAAEAELPHGVSIEKQHEGVALSGKRLRHRYWGSSARAPDEGLRGLIPKLGVRRGA